VDHRKGPRRRGEALEEAIMRAAMAELAEVGYAAVSMERIAGRARTSKAVLYRRWTGRADLIADAYFKYVTNDIEIPDTGDLRTDVVQLLSRLSERARPEVMHLIFGLLADAGDDGELLARVRERFAIIKPALMHDIIERAAARGEVREKLPPRARTLPIDLMRNELLQRGPDIPLSVIEEIVDDVFLPLVLA
jgi:AcrR family transcriptional regulator